MRPYGLSLRGDLRALVHGLDPGGVRGGGPEVSFQLLHLGLQRAPAGLALHLVHVHVQLVPLLLCTLSRTHKHSDNEHNGNYTCDTHSEEFRPRASSRLSYLSLLIAALCVCSAIVAV